MVDAGLSKSTRWALGAVFAVLSSLALAKGPSMPHGGGYPHASFQHQGHDNARTYAYRNERGARGAGGSHDGYNAGQRIAGPNDGYRANYNRAENRGYSQAYNQARYNEERGASRPAPRPPEYMSRPPGPSPYRN
jgi:hypothetical protein